MDWQTVGAFHSDVRYDIFLSGAILRFRCVGDSAVDVSWCFEMKFLACARTQWRGEFGEVAWWQKLQTSGGWKGFVKTPVPKCQFFKFSCPFTSLLISTQCHLWTPTSRITWSHFCGQMIWWWWFLISKILWDETYWCTCQSQEMELNYYLRFCGTLI